MRINHSGQRTQFQSMSDILQVSMFSASFSEHVYQKKYPEPLKTVSGYQKLVIPIVFTVYFISCQNLSGFFELVMSFSFSCRNLIVLMTSSGSIQSLIMNLKPADIPNAGQN